jgi:copper transport protein
MSPESASTKRARRAAAALAGVVMAVVGVQVLLAGPASAHAELLETQPANGQRLAHAPAEITLRFGESVGIVAGGLRLINADTGEQVSTPDARSAGDTIRWPMPTDLPDGVYLVSWRVISADSHPAAGAFRFGIGVDAPPVEDQTTTAGAPWELVLARWLGYLAFAAVAGVVAVASLCWEEGRGDRRMDLLLRSGLVGAVAATVLLLLLQGPYEAGVSYWNMFDASLLSQVAHSDFGPWIELRALLFLALAALLWEWGALQRSFNRWAAGVALIAAAVTFSGTGHAAASGELTDRLVDLVHILAAAVWVGGLLTLVVLSIAAGVRPGVSAFQRFSRLAMASVLVIVVTGTLNALLRLDAWSQLWDTGYGRLLSVKLILVAAVLATASFSRLAVGRGEAPWRPVRVEAVGTVAILAVTSVLTLTAPPPSGEAAGSSTGHGHGPVDTVTVSMPLAPGGPPVVDVVVSGTTTTGSRLLVRLPEGVEAKQVTMEASLPAKDFVGEPIDLHETPGGWAGTYTFFSAGEWTLALAIHTAGLTPTTQGTVTID